MKPHKTPILISGVILIFILMVPVMSAPVAATDVEASEHGTRISVGDTFVIDTRGRMFRGLEPLSTWTPIKMHLEFCVQGMGDRRVYLNVTSGLVTIGETQLTVVEGIGVIGRPTEGRFRGRIVFGIRLNLTSVDGNNATISIRGTVRHTHDHGPVLLMRGRILIDGDVHGLAQIGRASRIQS
ncbi:MAG: hypothetical protein ACP6IT_06175 [Candidatus Thorarchaeota archaeon]